MDLASVVAALASVGVRVSGSTPNNNIQGDSSRACPTGLAGPEPSGTLNDPGQHFQAHAISGVKSGGEGGCGHFGQNGQNSPKSGPSKYRISVSQGKGASGFCMDVNRSFASLLQQGLRFKAQ